jgi:hypothetical protein
VLPSKILRPLDKPLTDSDSQSSFSYVDYVQEVLIQEACDNGDLCKGHVITTLVLSYKAFNCWLALTHHAYFARRVFCRPKTSHCVGTWDGEREMLVCWRTVPKNFI